MGFSIQKGGQGDLLVQVVRGADGDGLHLRVGEELAVVGVGALEAEVLDGGALGLLDGVGGGHQPDLGAELREALRDGAVAAGVEPAHPPQGDDADPDLLLGAHDCVSPDGRHWPV